jgi:beta-mannosidase
VTRRLREENVLEIHCRPLTPELERTRRPRARWRTKVAHNGLRFYRTSLLGRSPGFAPSPAPVGPWRAVSLVHRAGPTLETLTLRPRLEGNDGVLAIAGTTTGTPSVVEIEIAGGRTPLEIGEDGFVGTVRIPDAARWWPHTHGEPALHDCRLLLDGSVVAERRIGFRELAGELPLRINGVPVFARGAVWTPVDAVTLTPTPDELRRALEQVVDCGMNMLRLVGLGAYESECFHDLCDELGILVWQDFMFANFDYPLPDDAFREAVTAEAGAELAVVAGRPSLVVLCGNSEVEQQVGMLGLDAAEGRGELFGELLPSLAAEAGADAVYVTSSPSGGDLPFSPRSGVANYFGVGGYRRPLEDARRAEVLFAGECLAFANVPGDEAAAMLGPVHHPRWKQGVPRDNGSGWDFEDVRDHYLRLLFDVDPADMRRFDHDRYLELSRATTGEVMAEVFGEWRRAASACGGGLVLWLRDLVPGAGWGVLEDDGTPKACWYHLRRALAPVAVWTTDEGMNGVDVHVANDRPRAFDGSLRVAFYARTGHAIAEVTESLTVEPRGACTRNAEAMLGRFVDAAWSYRFGPSAHEALVTTLRDAEGAVVSRAFRFPAGRPLPMPAEDLGLEAHLEAPGDGETVVRVTSRRLAYGVRVRAAGFVPDDDSFSLEPGGEHVVRLSGSGSRPFRGVVTALNLDGAVHLSN